MIDKNNNIVNGVQSHRLADEKSTRFDEYVQHAKFIKSTENSNIVPNVLSNGFSDYIRTEEAQNLDGMLSKAQRDMNKYSAHIGNKDLRDSFRKSNDDMAIIAQHQLAKDNLESVATIFMNLIKQIPKLMQLQ